MTELRIKTKNKTPENDLMTTVFKYLMNVHVHRHTYHS